MADILLSTLVGGGGLPQLAPDLNYPANKIAVDQTIIQIAGIDGSSGLVTALSLTGKYYINFLRYSGITNESMTHKLTVDGVVIWNDSAVSGGSSLTLLGSTAITTQAPSETIQCNTSFLLEVSTATDTSINLSYLARPIL